MKKKIVFSVFFIFWVYVSFAEIKHADIPNIDSTPSLKTVLSQKNGIMKQQQESEGNVVSGISTNGYVLPEGNIIVDNPVEPKCVFYANYNGGTGDAFQYVDVDTIVFECQ